MNQSASNLSILGIDVSKGKFDVALLREGKCKHKRFLNNLEGFKKLREWLAEYKVERLHACMESTSTYGEALVEMRQQEINRLDVSDAVIKKTIGDHIDYLTKQIDSIKEQINKHIDRHPQLRDKQKLLQSIPGVGEATIHLVLANFANTEKFSNAKRLSAFLGIAPREYQSGHSVRGRRRMSKVGRSSLRKAFFMPALVALRYNPIIVEMKRRLTEAGKPKMLIVGAAMRKLIHIIYGVL